MDRAAWLIWTWREVHCWTVSELLSTSQRKIADGLLVKWVYIVSLGSSSFYITSFLDRANPKLCRL
jgi:hypothetical protein